MIRAKTLRIQEFRGIRDLTLHFAGKNFAICGPNGTGKSGIVDALEFALTGNISRLSGAGTGSLSIKDHGPHVDSRNKPDKAVVTLTVDIPSIGKEVTITRSVREPKRPTFSPDDTDVRSVLNRVAAHPEFTLSRRELIRYVLAEPGKRAKEVQELLRLDEVESVRGVLQRIANACERDAKTLRAVRDSAASALSRALVIAKLTAAEILSAANERRAILTLPPISVLEANTSIKDGVVSTGTGPAPPRISKAQARGEVAQLRAELAQLSGAEFKSWVSDATAAVNSVAQDEKFMKSASREALLRSALTAFDENQCPVCDTPWKPEEFRAHLAKKLSHFETVAKQRKIIEGELARIADGLNRLRSAVEAVALLGDRVVPRIECAELKTYVTDLGRAGEQLQKLLPLEATLATLSAAGSGRADAVTLVNQIDAAILALPEPSQQDAARDFLSVGQEKLEAYRHASLQLRIAEQKATTAQFVLDKYGKVTTAALEQVYKDVEGFFTKLYRLINHDDEDAFQAHLRPSMGKLGFDVDFYGRGFFPPGAYHSEGHQDGMGLCLYLALMDHLAGPAFTFAVLDDVLMSVDSGHRREVSKLLREKFPNTQFILTTHDEIWLRHMKTVGLIEPKRFAHFRTWDVSVGPTEWDDREAWEEIAADLKKNDVRSAAALLRNYLEHFAKEACQELRAPVEFRGDAQFTLGDLLPSAVGRMKKYFKAAKAAAQSWGDSATAVAIAATEGEFDRALAASQLDQWQVNAAVHYNEWANLTASDFVPVVDAYKALTEAFTCRKCNSMLYATPPAGEPESLRCACTQSSLNLVKKTQSAGST